MPVSSRYRDNLARRSVQPPHVADAELDDAQAWAFVTFELSCHNKGSDEWIGTLNRLLRKHEALENLAGDRVPRERIPVIRAHELRIERQSWTLNDLIAAHRPSVHWRREPRCDACPILVIELEGAHFVLDGHTRVNRRIADNARGPHPVILIRAGAHQ